MSRFETTATTLTLQGQPRGAGQQPEASAAVLATGTQHFNHGSPHPGPGPAAEPWGSAQSQSPEGAGEQVLPAFTEHMLPGWVSGDRREAGKPRRNQRSARVGDEPQEMLSSKNMPFLKGKQSLEGVRSPRGEESKTVRLTGRPVEQQRSPLPTHFLCD